MYRNARGILALILEAKERELERLRPRSTELRQAAESAAAVRDFEGALRGERVRLIAEFKRRSPSAGDIRENANLTEIVRSYEAAGAAALSILTDRDFFAGSLADLQEGRKVSSLPILRKDFIVDELQLFESRASGADAILLIVRVLEDARLRDLLAAARALQLGVLVEAHDEAEAASAVEAGARVVGVNNRDLSTFRTDINTVLRILPGIPPEVVMVAESGIRDAADVERMGAAGIDAVLVGESLLRQPDPGAAAGALVRSTRQLRTTAMNV